MPIRGPPDTLTFPEALSAPEGGVNCALTLLINFNNEVCPSSYVVLDKSMHVKGEFNDS